MTQRSRSPRTTRRRAGGATRPARQVPLAVPPVPLLRETDEEETFFAGGRSALTQDALHRRLDAGVERWVAATCVWDRDFMIGDHRFVIFAIDVAPRTQVYVQLWSEPLEPVLCEVSSGRWNPPADTWLAGDRSARIEAFGFEIGGRAENFQREFAVKTPADVRRLARLIVDIMYAGFDYRGLQPINVHVCYQSRATQQPVLDALTPEDFTKVFAAHGNALKSDRDDEDRPVITLMTRGVLTTVTFGDRVPDQHLFRTAVVSCELPPGDEHAAEMQELRERLGPDVHVERARREMLLQFDGGVTAEWLSRRVVQWTAMIVEVQRQLRRARRKRAALLPAGNVH